MVVSCIERESGVHRFKTVARLERLDPPCLVRLGGASFPPVSGRSSDFRNALRRLVCDLHGLLRSLVRGRWRVGRMASRDSHVRRVKYRKKQREAIWPVRLGDVADAPANLDVLAERRPVPISLGVRCQIRSRSLRGRRQSRNPRKVSTGPSEHGVSRPREWAWRALYEQNRLDFSVGSNTVDQTTVVFQ